MKRTILALLTLSAALLAGCDRAERPTRSGLLRSDFQTTVEERQTDLYALANAAGMEVCITPFGGRIVSMVVPDRDGEPRDVVLGFDNIEDYRTVPSDFGASIGRYANRIAEGRFTLDGVTYDLPKNNFGHCLHGGPEGWQYRLYEAEQPAGNVLKLTLRSQDGEMGFPGAVTAQVTLTLTDDSRLSCHKHGMKIKIRFWRMLPYISRLGISTREDNPRDLDGCIRIYPMPVTGPVEPIYL